MIVHFFFVSYWRMWDYAGTSHEMWMVGLTIMFSLYAEKFESTSCLVSMLTTFNEVDMLIQANYLLAYALSFVFIFAY